METTARLFNCARCRCQVALCSYCDRGNIYCGQGCSQQGRRESVRAAGRRYQRTRRGRFAHAERQRRYRLRVRKVTHQGSADLRPDALLSPETRIGGAQSATRLVTKAQGLLCQFCKRLCSPFVRLDFLHRPAPRRNVPPWAWPPPAM